MKQVNEIYAHGDFELGFLLGKKLSSDSLVALLRASATQKLIVIDTNILLHHMDILEDSSSHSVFDVVIIPQTALSELRNLNISFYKRALALMKDEDRRFVFFPNSCDSHTTASRLVFKVPPSYR